MTAPRTPSGRISLMVSDVDGTLVDKQKAVTPGTVAAVRRLRDAGVHFCAVSARPPRGMKILVEALGLDLFGGFNGGSILRGDFSVVEQHFVAREAAETGIAMMAGRGAGIWVFADNEWFLTDPDNQYVAGEIRTVAFQPTVVSAFGDHVARAGKIVGASSDFAMLEQCEAELAPLLGEGATVKRSQAKYLDLTPPGTDKGFAVREFARHFGVPLDEVAVIGDMHNDLPMFANAGLRFAMGNAADEVKAQADVVTTANDADGVAQAIEHYVLPRAARGG
ncbi:Cof-type HAD-IIB family hydrolase [Ancylobacter oerskovii]|uniref:Cof-type HAD-IIB family hydrolase n=1 Tax=Ancylobacter oerskovii TaxID=459519 RepID=A0ABW4YVN4_9HYPH|nr:Cof-type HAD-IIB family hydrolase [Ancylobacter oerskovii]MBS7544208.1 HAD family phosphatase [Ancylobacter oerskovii]